MGEGVGGKRVMRLTVNKHKILMLPVLFLIEFLELKIFRLGSLLICPETQSNSFERVMQGLKTKQVS